LDGLRGWAALVVCMGHTALTFTYDAPNQPEFLKYIQTGYFRIIFDGGLSVKIFFILSGIVLSMAFIKSHDSIKLASLVIKRIPRLAIPILAMAVISHIFMKTGLMYNNAAIQVLEKNTWLSWCYNFNTSLFKVVGYTFLPTFFGGGNPYSTALWTMPHEMIGSIFLVVVLFVSQYINRKKIFIPLSFLSLGLVVFAYKAGDRSAYSSTFICFLTGILFSYYINNKEKFRATTVWFKMILFALIIWLYYNKYNLDLKINLIAALVVLFALISPVFQKALSTKFSLFLGKISFPLYVIHMTVICSLTSFLITKNYNPNNTKLVIIYFAATVLVSIICACILYPVEKFAIICSNKTFEYLSSEDKINLKEIVKKLKIKRNAAFD
jgi:peptidoglycan/LPS O-acetylase OafA/YrhL